jgi:hypothetical protein
MDIFISMMETKTLSVTDKTFIQKRTGIPQKREIIKKWRHIEDREYSYDEQLDLLKTLMNSKTGIHNEVQQQLKMKMSSYKGQDYKHFLSNKSENKKSTFHNVCKEGDIKKCSATVEGITFEDMMDLLIKSDLKCYYCSFSVKIIYRFMRDDRQWSLDRIDNQKTHTKENCVICCLKCNLERRRLDNSRFYTGKRIQYKKSLAE